MTYGVSFFLSSERLSNRYLGTMGLLPPGIDLGLNQGWLGDPVLGALCIWDLELHPNVLQLGELGDGS